MLYVQVRNIDPLANIFYVKKAPPLHMQCQKANHQLREPTGQTLFDHHRLFK